MLRIGLIGTGTVGGGVIQILEQKIAEYKEKLGDQSKAQNGLDDICLFRFLIESNEPLSIWTTHH